MHIVRDKFFLKNIAQAKVLSVKRGLNCSYLLPNEQVAKIIYHRFKYARAERLANKIIQNAKKLKKKQIGTLTINHIVRYPEYRAIVLYYPLLPQPSVLERFTQTQDLTWINHAFTALADLHKQKIYFSDFHPGNILVDETGNYSLIDLQSIKFAWFLPFRRQVRNFIKFFEGFSDPSLLSKEIIYSAALHYLQARGFSSWKKKRFLAAIGQFA